MSRIFAHGELRLYLLTVLDEAPRHGYEIIRLLEDRFEGTYSPSAGTIYPRLAALEDEGLIDHVDEDDRKVYRITEAGREELRHRGHDIRRLERDIERSTRRLAREIRKQVEDTVNESLQSTLHGVGSSVRETVHASTTQLHEELRATLETLRPQSAGRQLRWERREERRTRTSAGPEYLRLLRAELDVFAAEVIDVARRGELDLARLSALRAVLVAARAQAVDAVSDPAEAARRGAAGGGDDDTVPGDGHA